MSQKRHAPYADDDIYKDFFFTRVRRTVYKWWCVIYKPVYKLIHHGEWPEEKEPGYVPPKQEDATSDYAAQMADKLMHERQDTVNQTISSQTNAQAPAQSENAASDDSSTKITGWDDSFDVSGMSEGYVDLAKEIVERLAREAAEDEAKKQAEIEQAKQAAAEQARLEEIMRSNKVDISQYIEEGRAQAAAEFQNN
ncbi:MAG: hypothetical protein NC393_14410 [Clostridium sp.]|nr:hypothetical protein [Clostridium sp.]MCM1173305.1 hypothetical protein [Clostridium sp.]MCM1208846.1 hypothetical protein [Ruminococcus sp.]